MERQEDDRLKASARFNELEKGIGDGSIGDVKALDEYLKLGLEIFSGLGLTVGNEIVDIVNTRLVEFEYASGGGYLEKSIFCTRRMLYHTSRADIELRIGATEVASHHQKQAINWLQLSSTCLRMHEEHA